MHLLTLNDTTQVAGGNLVSEETQVQLKAVVDLTLLGVEYLPYVWAGLIICQAPIASVPASAILLSNIVYYNNTRNKVGQ